MSSARARVAVSSSSAATTLLIRPDFSASVALMLRAVYSISFVFRMPIVSGQKKTVGGMPRSRAAGWPKLAASLATTRSETASNSPAPDRQAP